MQTQRERNRGERRVEGGAEIRRPKRGRALADRAVGDEIRDGLLDWEMARFDLDVLADTAARRRPAR